MKRIIVILTVHMMRVFDSYAQLTLQQTDSVRRREVQDSIRNLTNEDHKAMMVLLKIDSLRPGANGSNPHAPNAANYDEAKANPFPNLPDPLMLKNGKKVTDANNMVE